MKILRLTIVALLALAACAQKSNDPSVQRSTLQEHDSPNHSSEKFNRIIFFTPSSEELMQMLDAGGDEGGLSDVVSDFEYNAGIYQQNPGRSDIDIRFTDKREILVFAGGSKKVIKRTAEHPFGIVMTDNVKEPMVDYNVRVPAEIREMAEKYFGAAPK